MCVCMYECVGFEIDFPAVDGAVTGHCYLPHNSSQVLFQTHWQRNMITLNALVCIRTGVLYRSEQTTRRRCLSRTAKNTNSAVNYTA